MRNLAFSVLVTAFGAVLLLSASASVAAGPVACSPTSLKSNQSYKVNVSGIELKTAPGPSSTRMTNEKATAALKRPIYLTIDNSTTVLEECSESGYSRVRVLEPDWLRETHIGWVASTVLRRKQRDAKGLEVFTEVDFVWDKTTTLYKKVIVAGVNKVRRENSRCKDIDTATASISRDKSRPGNPTFFVTCGKGVNVFNAYFSKADVEKDVTLGAAPHIDRAGALQLCENHAKAKATNPDTVDFSRFLHAAVREHPNGRTTVLSKFSAKNAMNMEFTYDIRCLLDANGVIEASIARVGG